jgi:hypothetical protein
VIGLPLPSQRTWILVERPPWLRPKASAAGVLFLPRQHAGGRARYFHPQSGSPNPLRPECRPAPAVRLTPDPKCRLLSNDETDCRRWTTDHTARVDPAMVHLSVTPTRSHSPWCDDRWLDGRCGASEAAGVASVVPIVPSSSRLGSWRRIIPNFYEFANTP